MRELLVYVAFSPFRISVQQGSSQQWISAITMEPEGFIWLTSRYRSFSVTTPADPRGEQKEQIFGSENLLEKCRCDFFRWPERGLKLFGHVSDRFSDLSSRFSKRFSCQATNVSGAILFCKRATLKIFVCATSASRIFSVLLRHLTKDAGQSHMTDLTQVVWQTRHFFGEGAKTLDNMRLAGQMALPLQCLLSHGGRHGFVCC